MTMKKGIILSLVLVVCMFSTARAGNIYLTGHDVLLHSGQNGYDSVIHDY